MWRTISRTATAPGVTPCFPASPAPAHVTVGSVDAVAGGQSTLTRRARGTRTDHRHAGGAPMPIGPRGAGAAS